MGSRLAAQAAFLDFSPHPHAARLTELGVRHEILALEGAPHGMENWEGRPEWLAWKRRVVEWISGLPR